MSSAAQPALGDWGYLGGFFAYFIGWFAGLIGCIQFTEAAESADPDSLRAAGFALVALGVLMFVVGVHVMARVGPVRLSATNPGVFVLFVLTPIPAVLGFGLNRLGQVFRQSDAFALRVALLAVGASLIGMAVMWISDGALEGGRNDDRSFLWAMALQGGLALGGLGLFPPQRVVTDEPVELASAES